ncbi:MAG: carboxypeptidase-like regulatory domain-containing protein [Saprospiraceae bacterium]
MHKILTLLLILFSIAGYSQNYTISGYIEDFDSGEKLISAYIYDNLSGKGTVTNTYGFYSLTLPKDSVELKISYIGYTTEIKKILLDKNTEINFKLKSSVQLQEIEISGTKNERIEEQTQMSKIEVL